MHTVAASALPSSRGPTHERRRSLRKPSCSTAMLLHDVLSGVTKGAGRSLSEAIRACPYNLRLDSSSSAAA
jgi:hypothetical protein